MRPGLQGFWGGGAANDSNFKNGDFVDITSWTVIQSQIKLNGLSIIGGWPTPTDNKPTPQPVGDSANGYCTYTFALSSADLPPGFAAPQQALSLQNSGTSVAYGTVHGPAVISDQVVDLVPGQQVKFWWRGLAGGDAYDIYAYLLNIDNGNTVELINETGPDNTGVTNWALVTATVPVTGNYKFVFIAGTYDYTGGTVVGGLLLITGIGASPPLPFIGSVTAETDPVAEEDTVTLNATYANFSGEPVYWALNYTGNVRSNNFVSNITTGVVSLTDSGTLPITVYPTRNTIQTANWTYGIKLGSTAGASNYYITSNSAFHVIHYPPNITCINYNQFFGETVYWKLNFTGNVRSNNFVGNITSGSIGLTGNGTQTIYVYPTDNTIQTGNWTYGMSLGSTVGSSNYYTTSISQFHVSDYVYDRKVLTLGQERWLSTPYSTNYNFGTGDFTIEWWWYLPGEYSNGSAGTGLASPGGPGIGQRTGTESNGWSDASGWIIYRDNSELGNKICFRADALDHNGHLGSTIYKSIASPTSGVYQHWAIVRSGTTLTFYLNGTASGVYTGVDTNITAYNYINMDYISSTKFNVGWYSNNNQFALNDTYITNLRIVKGIAVYTGNFTKSTKPLKTTQPAGINISAITDPLNTVLLIRNTVLDESIYATPFDAYSVSAVFPEGPPGSQMPF